MLAVETSVPPHAQVDQRRALPGAEGEDQHGGLRIQSGDEGKRSLAPSFLIGRFVVNLSVAGEAEVPAAEEQGPEDQPGGEEEHPRGPGRGQQHPQGL